MKKAFLILAVAAAVASCNNDGASTDNLQDSVVEAIDSTADARIDSIQETTDSVINKVENTFEKTDSANKAIADSTAR
jgi:hypothetical protein